MVLARNPKGWSLCADCLHFWLNKLIIYFYCQAFKSHKLHDPLEEPGTADLTADVDFAYLKKFTGDEVDVFGPITQERYLNNMGIGYRLQALLQTCHQEHWSSLISGYKMLTSPDQMGERFKFMAIMHKEKQNYIPAGFVSLNIPEGTKR
uniref:Protein arginine methyltransferase NDUFAF7 n=1 Tax=Biomphalaria glabrata TaxID=6526 RepID=A0A2C9LDV3_BIOGL